MVPMGVDTTTDPDAARVAVDGLADCDLDDAFDASDPPPGDGAAGRRMSDRPGRRPARRRAGREGGRRLEDEGPQQRWVPPGGADRDHRPPHRLGRQQGRRARRQGADVRLLGQADGQPLPRPQGPVLGDGGRRHEHQRQGRSARPAPGGLGQQPGDRHRGRQQRDRRAVARHDAGLRTSPASPPWPTSTASRRAVCTPTSSGPPVADRPGRPEPVRHDQRQPVLEHGRSSGPPSRPAATGAPRRPRRSTDRVRAGDAGDDERGTYVVQPGDSWWSIAAATIGDPATTWPTVAAANGGPQRVLRPGEVISIPGGGSGGPPPWRRRADCRPASPAVPGRGRGRRFRARRCWPGRRP